jgi:transposase
LGDARGRPIAFRLSPGEATDCKAYEPLMDLPEQVPDALIADKTYNADAIRHD